MRILTRLMHQRLVGLLNITANRNLVKDILKVVGGNTGTAALGFLSTLIIIRSLSPIEFGSYAIASAVMLIASQLTDLGLNTAYVRFAAGYIKENPEKADRLTRITLEVKVALGIIVFVTGLLLSPIMAHYVWNDDSLTVGLRLAFLGSFGNTLWNYLQAVLQAHQHFGRYSVISITNNLIKFISIIILFYLGMISVESSLAVMAAVPFFGFFIDRFVIPRNTNNSSKINDRKELIAELVGFGKWVTLATIATMIISRLDVLMLGIMSTNEEVAYYDSALRLAMIFPMLTGALTTVLLPRVSRLHGTSALRKYAKQSLFATLLISIPLLIGLLIAGPIITIFFGQEYGPAILPFQLILGAFIISTVTNPLNLIFYNLGQTKLLALMNTVQLFINIGLNIIFIPKFGATGAAYSALSLRITAAIYIFGLLPVLLRKKSIDEIDDQLKSNPPKKHTSSNSI